LDASSSASFSSDDNDAPGGVNPVIQAIRSRRSIRKMLTDSPTKEQVATILEAATWAPNHHLTEPWRFVVIASDERRRLGDALAEALLLTSPETPHEKVEMERAKPLTAPVIIAMVASPQVGPKIVPQEELIAAGAALQNMLLAAHALGLSTMVRTGVHGFSDRMRLYFEMNEGESLVGMVYLGYPSERPPLGKRSGYHNKTNWRGM
jgi:nitroreductase